MTPPLQAPPSSAWACAKGICRAIRRHWAALWAAYLTGYALLQWFDPSRTGLHWAVTVACAAALSHWLAYRAQLRATAAVRRRLSEAEQRTRAACTRDGTLPGTFKAFLN